MALKKCFNCGGENESTAKFCMHCGSKLSMESSDNNLISEGECSDVAEEDCIDVLEQACPDISEKDSIDVLEDNCSAELEPEGSNKKNNRKKISKKNKIIIAVAAVVIVILAILFSSPNIVSIEATYDGDTEEGTVLDENNEGFYVIGTDENGEKYELSGWDVEEPATLQADSSSIVHINYKNLSCDVNVECSTSDLEYISAIYDGETEEGTVLDTNNSGIIVYAEYKNGSESTIEIGDCIIEEPATLEADKTSTVTIKYETSEATYECDVEVECSTHNIEKITANYTGNTEEGTVIDTGDEDVKVIAHYANGETEEVSDWTIKNKVTLKAGKTSKLKISYADKECTVKVECSTMSKEQYKKKCSSYSYETIARDPDKYNGKMAKFTGEVIQVLEGDDNIVAMRINITEVSYGYTDTIYAYYVMPDGASRILEDDIITIYGELNGLYSYEAVSGATITLPLIYVKYVEQ